MKTAISIPDPIFKAAEETAKKLGMSRSELYAKAVKEFLEIYQRNNVTKTLNELYDDEPSGLDQVINQAQEASLDREKW